MVAESLLPTSPGDPRRGETWAGAGKLELGEAGTPCGEDSGGAWSPGLGHAGPLSDPPG